MKGTKRTSDIPIALGCGLALTAVLVAFLAPGPAFGEQDEEEKAFLRAKGRVTYRVYCINCHGPKGKGDGKLAELLTVEPTDLTQIKKKNDGKFSPEKVRTFVDGTTKVRGHGRQEMPVWGDAFATSPAREYYGEEGTGEERAERKIRELVVYLESIQEEE